MAYLPYTSALTLKGKGILGVLISPEIEIYPANELKVFKTRAIWDTGASHTVITKEVVDALDLKPAGKTRVNTASEVNIITDVYYVDIKLPNSLIIKTVRVSLGKITENIGCLIGMDIIALGDFSITNFGKKTCMSFRYPSQHEIDFVKELEESRNNPTNEKKN